MSESTPAPAAFEGVPVPQNAVFPFEGLPIAMSPSIGQFAAALAAAQAEYTSASKDSVNPHFKSRYADLASVAEACGPALSKHGIARMQFPVTDGARCTVATMLLHKSGEYVISALTLVAQQNTPQGIGSTITYGRRYGLSTAAGVVADDDDDGNAATMGGSGVASRAESLAKKLDPRKPVPRPEPMPRNVKDENEIVAEIKETFGGARLLDEDEIEHLASELKKVDRTLDGACQYLGVARNGLTTEDADKISALVRKALEKKQEAAGA
jgi:hypothetical protein